MPEKPLLSQMRTRLADTHTGKARQSKESMGLVAARGMDTSFTARRVGSRHRETFMTITSVFYQVRET
jgi:hypothetical protein